jgi:hypothetical protein
MNRRGVLLTLSWLWLAVVIAYLAWGGIAQAGLYYWVGTLEVDRLGTWNPKLTGIVPGLLLALPALLYIGREARRQRLAPPDPVAGARMLRLVGQVLVRLGLAALAVGLACYLLALTQPSGAERAIPLDAAALGNGPPPAWKVGIAGAIDERAEVSVDESSRFSTSYAIYVGFRATGEADREAPLRLFVVHGAPHQSGPVAHYDGLEAEGYLVENGLPPLVLYTLERRGVRIASPHYLLLTGRTALRDPYYGGAMVGAIFGFLLTACGLLVRVLPGQRGRSGANPAGG